MLLEVHEPTVGTSNTTYKSDRALEQILSHIYINVMRHKVHHFNFQNLLRTTRIFLNYIFFTCPLLTTTLLIGYFTVGVRLQRVTTLGPCILIYGKIIYVQNVKSFINLMFPLYFFL